MSTCRFCDQTVHPGADKCPSCGAPIDQPGVNTPDDLDQQVQRLLEQGKKLEAVKLYMNRTGVSLKEAKDVVESMPRAQNLAERPEVAGNMEAEILQLMGNSQKIQAIRLYREHTGARLVDAKKAVEDLAQRHGVVSQGGGCLSVLAVMLVTCTVALALLRVLAATAAAAEEPLLVITKDTSLDPATTYGRIEIRASDITLDGRGAWLVGATEGHPRDYQHVAISAAGVSGVTIRNVNAKGWETGLYIENGNRWTIENCNFSDNFHDPDFGWGENGRRGGIVLKRVKNSTLRKNVANHVWDACVLVDSHDNALVDNDFSHTSNTCLKLWNSCRNRVERCNLSYGLRINPGEVHARDSAGLLIESGSNDNRFVENDCTHGGDGVFVRALNGWVNSGNVFERNDASYAHNNCFEAWCPRNQYLDNKANHGSYGFWLGASDQTVLIGNEASYNGLPAGHHNSPHLPDGKHAGIVFMFGPSSHTVARNNTCVGNNGAGIALIGDMETAGSKSRAFHWILNQNTLSENRWGIFMQYADWIDLAGNIFKNNEEDVCDAGGVTNLTRYADNPRIVKAPQAQLTGPSIGTVGEKIVLDASLSSDPTGNPLSYRWNLGDGTIVDQPRVVHVFRAPGFYRVGVTVNNGSLSDLAWRDFYVVEDGREWGTEGQAAEWGWIEPQSKVAFRDDTVHIAGQSSVRALVDPYSGMLVNLLYPHSRQANLALTGRTQLVFWIKAINENVPAWQGPQPIVTLYETEETYAVLTPTVDFLSSRPNNEEREGWSYFVVPLAGNEQWELKGDLPATLNYVTIGCDSWDAPPLRLWIDGLSLR